MALQPVQTNKGSVPGQVEFAQLGLPLRCFSYSLTFFPVGLVQLTTDFPPNQHNTEESQGRNVFKK